MRQRARIRNLVSDVHKKFAKFLVDSYDLVLLPKFETSQMVRRETRRIRSKVARMMLTWAHYRFQQTLLNHSKRSTCHFEIVSEAYTSKTCGKCGILHPSLGGAKTL